MENGIVGVGIAEEKELDEINIFLGLKNINT